ncbi:MAG TPA: sugar ABC transporter permease [Jatrophihabitantaceae bacterium]|nr:sugar ABC transporter permease [Jatrophihabitantaceae bacterium]
MSATATVAKPAREASRVRVVRRQSHGRSPVNRPITGIALVTPAVCFVVAFVVVPLIFAIYISLTDWPLIGRYHYVGLQNYAAIGKDQAFWHATVYTLAYTAIVTVPILVVGYAMAVFVRDNRRGSTFFRTVFFLPYVIGLSTLSFLALLELQPGSGAVNAVLRGLHITNGQTAWLVNTVPATTAICVLVVWAVSGLTMMLIMAGMQGISADVYESAELDGAGWWDKELRITVPLLRRTIAMSLILSIIGSFLAFNQFYILTQGGPGTSTTTVVMWIYDRAFVELHLGAATALSIVLVVVVAIVSAAQFRLLRVDK